MNWRTDMNSYSPGDAWLRLKRFVDSYATMVGVDAKHIPTDVFVTDTVSPSIKGTPPDLTVCFKVGDYVSPDFSSPINERDLLTIIKQVSEYIDSKVSPVKRRISAVSDLFMGEVWWMS